jgi:hypothetical protein
MFFDLSRYRADQADLLQELLCMEIEAAAKSKERKVLLVLDDLCMIREAPKSIFNRLITQVDRHVSVIFSCGDLLTACGGDSEVFNQVGSKADTDVFLFAQPSASMKPWSGFFGEHPTTLTETESRSDFLPGPIGEFFGDLATTRTYSKSIGMGPKFSPDTLASLSRGWALARISSENQIYALTLPIERRFPGARPELDSGLGQG